MTVDSKALAAKIRQLYPEIDKYGLEMKLTQDPDSSAWLLQLAKGSDTLKTHLENTDALSCLDGKECVYLTTQIARFIEAYCLRGDSCPVQKH